MDDMRRKMKASIDMENQKQKEKFEKLKEQYDRDGIQFIQDERDMQNAGAQLKKSKRGVIKPGSLSEKGMNMGGDEERQKNPIS